MSVATVTSLNVAYLYNRSIYVAPPPLPPTSKNNFIVYVNGVTIDPTSFDVQQVGANIQITFFNNSSVVVGDYVTVIGKYV